MESLGFGSALLASAEGGSHSSPWGIIAYFGFLLVLLVVIQVYAKRGFSRRVFTNPVSRLYEHVYLFIENLCVGTIGEHGRKYIPMIMSLWLVIFVGNLIALTFPTSPTADLSFNLGMALIAVFYTQWEGISSHYSTLRAHGQNPVVAGVGGFFKHILHFAGPRLGLAYVIISAMLFVIEIISELMKNVSLSLRLYANIHGGHEAVTAMNHLGDALYLPLGGVLLPLKLLTCVVQALIFTLLTCVYISLVTHHEEDEHGPEHGTAASAPALAH